MTKAVATKMKNKEDSRRVSVFDIFGRIVLYCLVAAMAFMFLMPVIVLFKMIATILMILNFFAWSAYILTHTLFLIQSIGA
jgi:hypothetical protein